MNFTATYQKPSGMSLKAALGWEYFFGKAGCWQAAHIADGCWIVTDEECNLDNARIFPDDDTFFEWMEFTVDDNLDDDPGEFLKNFVSIPELLSDDVILAIMETLDGSDR